MPLQKRVRLKRRALFVFGGMIWLLLFFGRQLLAGNEVVFVAYNLENYTLHSSAGTRPKADRARDAVAQMIAELRPDLLGVCEIGSLDAVEDLRERLRLRGIEFRDVELVAGPDPERHLALLSRYPLVSRQSRPRVAYELNGIPQLVRRGFLDVVVELDGAYRLRLVGAHLKSKLPVPEGESLVRRMEAQLLRGHVDSVLLAEPNTPLLVYGDLNDTREQPAIREILGNKGSAGALVDLPAEDSLGDRWTHYWRTADVYSRIDYLLVNKALFPRVVKGSARVWRSPIWREASDHRPLSLRILPQER
jgi:endonuclease/exonuclease/phosphatase family metal-dependent hydrolase